MFSFVFACLFVFAVASDDESKWDTVDVPAVCRTETCIAQWRDDGHTKQSCYECGKLYGAGFLKSKFPPVKETTQVKTPAEVFNSVAKPNNGDSYNYPNQNAGAYLNAYPGYQPNPWLSDYSGYGYRG